MPGVLILSNEVVKMRGEVKRVKVLLIRKIIRQISVLEKKKGGEAVLEKFRRRADRLREEIHELKTISPDSITKAALQKDISFEKVCQNKEASLSERAIARVATHPQFSKKIQSIKAAIKAFKEERINALNDEEQANNNAENSTSLDQSQAESDDDELDLEKSSDEDDDDDVKLKEDEGDKKTDEDRQQEIDGSREESQKTSVETINEQTNQCQKEELLTVEKSSETVGIPEEVIRMRKEVKRTRVLIISKMAEQMASLKKKKKKSQESEVKESQEKAAEIMKKIKALRSLKLDQVSMTALQENVDFEKVLQDSQASPVDRAIAHIATHSRFINKLQKVKEAIKEERAKAEQKKMDKLDTVQSKNEDEESEEGTNEEGTNKDKESEEEPEEDEGSEEETEDDEESEEEREEDEKPKEGDVIDETLNSSNPEILASSVAEPTESKDSDLIIVPPSKIVTTSPKKPKSVEVKSQKAEATAPNIKSSLEKISTVSKKNISKASKEMKATLKPQKKKDLPETKRVEAEKDKEESDLSDEEEEKEYFDDSTEERFHKQSSQSEESDDDDFFLGKVSKFKKRKSKVEEKKSELQKTDKEATGKPHETNLGKLQSVFCSVLSKSSVSSQKAKFGSRSDGPRPPRFQNQRKGPEGRMKASQYKGQDPGTDRRTGPFKPNRETFKGAEQKQAGPSGAVRERPPFEQKRNPRGPPGRMSDPPKQALHPSWEASKKRKEQQSQITGFQGKKIKFDDDD